MILKVKTRKRIAVFFHGIIAGQMITPSLAHALTSGPTQPEVKQFAAAGSSEMVDLFTGDFKYNIPLLDVEGYPINLNYASGVNMDDEASWVGLGWNLNVGAINRNMRGVADDANGDIATNETYFKPQITYGGRATLNAEVSGFQFAKLKGSLSVGVFSDNYNGIGAEFGVNSGMSLSVGGLLTAEMGTQALSNTSSGVDRTKYKSIDFMNFAEGSKLGPGVASSVTYNSRSGIKQRTLSRSFGLVGIPDEVSNTQSFNTPAIYPRSATNMKSSDWTYSFNLGGMSFLLFTGGGVTGYKRKRQLAEDDYSRPAFGMLYADRGKDDRNALMDFLREKENPVVKGLPNLPIPVSTPDVFTYTGQAGSGQFRLYNGGTGVLFDAASKSTSDVGTVGGDLGLGYIVHGGVTLYKQDVNTTTGKWVNQNNYLQQGDFRTKAAMDELNEETAYFKEVGEKSLSDANFIKSIKEEELVSVKLSNKTATSNLRNGAATYNIQAPLKKTGRQLRKTAISYLTAKEAAGAAMEPKLLSYPVLTSAFTPPSCNKFIPEKIDRYGGYRKTSHISEITVQSPEGQRMVYGIPVYNIQQSEYTFAVNKEDVKSDNMVEVKWENGKIKHDAGKDNYFNKEVQPSYAASYLLTSLLSPDYSDITGDGITSDDNGTAYKFNYSRVADNYNWRSPAYPERANYVKGLYADDEDDKGTFVHGAKEVWYTQSVESKNMVAYFITSERNDGLGVDLHGSKLQYSGRLRKLDEIRLYSKNDLTTPVKTVVFKYEEVETDALCPEVPNHVVDKGGKLTLKKIYFKYASSSKGEHNPYEFEYNVGPKYAVMAADRWGTYKPADANGHTSVNWPMTNEEFPYTIQDKSKAAEYAGVWNLNKIILPSGGTINVEYESDDYAYVQNKRSMEMTHITGMLKEDGALTTNLLEAKGLRLKIPPSDRKGEDPTEWFKREYLDNNDVLYTKMYIHLGDKSFNNAERFYDWVPSYGTVERVQIGGSGENMYADVWLKNKQAGGLSLSPMLLAAWQKMRQEYPVYAYPGYEDRIQHEPDIEAAVRQIGNAFKNMRELKQNFYERAKDHKYSQYVNLGKSYARIVKYDGRKFGGGARVKKLVLKDAWDEMTGSDDNISTGQAYEYTTELPGAKDGRMISSGVAAYEPATGGDENAMHLPVDYTEDIEGGLSNYYYIEKPFGEYLYPTPTVGYSKVTVRRLDGAGNVDAQNLTGYDVSEFFTARDFPVIVKSEGMPDEYNHQSNKSFFFFGGNAVHEKIMSQGYVVILNDMHGKPKAERNFNKAGTEIAATEYVYDDEPYESNSYRLRNRVKVVDEEGMIDPEEQVIGREIELFTHMREEESKNFGQTHAQGFDYFQIGVFPVVVPHWPLMINKEYRLYRSASLLKTVQYSGVVKKVIKKQDGAVISAENVLFDKLTGNPVVTSTENEFGDPVYTVSIPAYWTYPQMGGAYKNMSQVIQDMTTSSTGTIAESYAQRLAPGDELVNVDNGERFWVVKQPILSGGEGFITALIDETGKVRRNYLGTVKLCYSGYRNMLGAIAGSITTLKNPIINGNTLALFYNGDLSKYNVIDAKAVLYSEEWGRPGCLVSECPAGYQPDGAGNCIKVPVISNSQVLDYCESPQAYTTIYNSGGAAFYNSRTATSPSAVVSNNVWGKPSTDPHGTNADIYGELTKYGIRFCNSEFDYTGKWTGIKGCFTTTSAQTTYNIGISANGAIRVYLDNRNTPFIERAASLGSINYTRAHIYQVTIPAGQHTIWVEAQSATNEAASFYAQVYINDQTFLKNAVFPLGIGSLWGTPLNGVGNTLPTYILNAAGQEEDTRYTCTSGVLNICGNTPNCGSVPATGCPAGYNDLAAEGKCAVTATENTDAKFRIVKGTESASYGTSGASFYNEEGKVIETNNDNYWKSCYGSGNTLCGRLNRTSVWLNGPEELYGPDAIQGINTCFFAPVTGTYYIGYGTAGLLKVYVDDMIVGDANLSGPYDKTWTVKPIKLNAGHHNLRIDIAFKSVFINQPRAAGVEIYKNTLRELKAGTAVNAIFSTSNLIGQNVNTYYTSSSGVVSSRYSCTSGTVHGACGTGFYCDVMGKNNVINPYLLGYLGNWRPSENKVVETNRSDKNLFTGNAADGLDIRNSGAYKQFTPFWYLQGGKWEHDNTVPTEESNELWVTSNYITRYSSQGQELENKDALGRYSSAIYSYNGTLPTAVAANAQRREIFYESFDDYYFNRNCSVVPFCSSDDFKFYYRPQNTSISTEAHTGRYSYKVSEGFLMTALVSTLDHKPGAYLSRNTSSEYYKNYLPGLFKDGFSPKPDGKYVFSAWVKNGFPKNLNSKLILRVNGTDHPLNKKAAVEGWVLVEYVMDMSQLTFPDGLLSFRIEGDNDDNLLIDDVRLFPFYAHIKTYTYDDRNMRLMAELDENNYATFYEYDDEGSLIRVKKETEKGILTIKESRSAYRKKQ